jgi:uncharacterized protein YecE (DUF72 family)
VQVVKDAGKLGVVLFQFPPWFHRSRENFEYLLSCRERFPDFQLAFEFRTTGWTSVNGLNETLAFLKKNRISLVCVDEPQGLKTSVPAIAEVTSQVGVVRFHGRNTETWEKKNIFAEERFNYLYTDAELTEWVPKVKQMATQADKVHVIFKNKSRDYAVRNAKQFTEMLKR